MQRLRQSLAAAALAFCLASPALAGPALYEVTGQIAESQAPRAIGAEDLAKIGMTEIDTSIFVMGEETHKVRGVLMRDLVKYVGGKGQSVKITALDGYALDIPMSDFEAYDAVVATEIDGKPLSVRDKGPAWLIYPATDHPELKDTVYESRMVWQIKTIEID
jgi:hypothetical protein